MSDTKSDLKESLETLEKVLEAGSYNRTPIEATALRVNDLTEVANKYLTAGARYDLSQKATQSVVKSEDGRVFKAVYFSALVRTGNEEKAVQALARVMNDLSQRGLIHSTLAPISSIELARMPLQAQTSAVFCFVLVPESHEAYCSVRYKQFFTLEGGLGSRLDDSKPYLQPGEFLSEIRVTTTFLMREAGKSPSELLNNQIMTYLAILPKGTVVRQIAQCAITDLSIPFEVKFYNPIMTNIKSVNVGYTRAAAVVGDRLAEFNLLTDVSYFDENQNQLFKN